MTDDLKVNTEKNLKLVQNALPFQEIKYAKLIHGDTILHVDDLNFQSGQIGDALITNIPNITLMITHADCQAAILLDPKKKAIACIHAGWKGNTLNIYHKTVLQMKKLFGSNPKDLIVALSPSLGPKNSYFDNYKNEFPEELWKYKDPENRINLWKLAKSQFLKSGLNNKNIHLSGMCSYENKIFFSHRRERPTGRNATFVSLTF